MSDLRELVGEHATVEEYTTREEWLRARTTGIGASDLPIILGLSRYQSPLELWAHKVGIAEPDVEQSEAQEFGLLLEPVVKRKYQERTGRTLLGLAPWTIVRSIRYPWMLASLDDVVLPAGSKGPGAMEAKTTSAFRMADWEEEPPLAHQCQVQWQVAVAGFAWGSLGVVVGGQSFRWADVERSDKFLDVAMGEAADFWHLVESESQPAPDATDSSKRILDLLYPKAEPGKVIALPPICVEYDREITEAQAAIKEAEAVVDGRKNLIRAALAEAEAGTLPGGVVWNFKNQHREAYTVEEKDFRVLRRSVAKRNGG